MKTNFPRSVHEQKIIPKSRKMIIFHLRKIRRKEKKLLACFTQDSNFDL